MKNRRLFISILTGLCACLMSATLFTACGETHTHSYTSQTTTEASCREKGLTTYTCSCGDTYTEEILALGHDTKIHEAQAPTCTEKGWSEYVTCEREGCDYSTYEEILALKHDIVNHEAQAPTCAEIGWKAYKTCQREGCNYTTYKEISATGNHTWNNGEITTQPTCTELGVKTFKCTDCEKAIKTEDIKPLMHDIKAYDSKAPTCMESGWNTYIVCDRENCNYTTYKEIPAMENHTYIDKICSGCKVHSSAVDLNYTLNIDENSYTVTGFGNCQETEIVINMYEGKPVTCIGWSAFSRTNLTNIVIGDNVQYISSNAFGWCFRLTSIMIGSGVTTIEEKAFDRCYNLVEVVNKSPHFTIEKHAESNGGVGYYAFEIYNGGVVFTSRLSNDNGYIVYMDGNEKILVGYNGTETDLIFPTYLTQIKSQAFYLDNKLTSVKIENNIRTISPQAFYYCLNLTSVVIDNGVINIDDAAFAECHSLKYIEIPNSVKSIGNSVFTDCSSLTDLTISDNIENIGEEVFDGCDSLKYTIKRGLKYLGNHNNPYLYLASVETSEIEIAVIENSCKFIGFAAFKNCENLINVTIPNSVKNINSFAFYGCYSLTNIEIPDSVTTIERAAFYLCTKLENITIGKGVTLIDGGAFWYCANLKNIVLPNNVTTIYDSFKNCKSLTCIKIPKSVKYVFSDAFENCDSLTIYCEAEGKPSNWSSSWNCSRPVYWFSENEPALNNDGTAYDGNYWHYDTDGVTPVVWAYKKD